MKKLYLLYILLLVIGLFPVSLSCSSDSDSFSSDDYTTRAELLISSRMEPPSPRYVVIKASNGYRSKVITDLVKFHVLFNWDQINLDFLDPTDSVEVQVRAVEIKDSSTFYIVCDDFDVICTGYYYRRDDAIKYTIDYHCQGKYNPNDERHKLYADDYKIPRSFYQESTY